MHMLNVMPLLPYRCNFFTQPDYAAVLVGLVVWQNMLPALKPVSGDDNRP